MEGDVIGGWGLLKHATVVSIVLAGGLAGPAGTVGLVATSGASGSDSAAGRGDGGSGSAQRAPSRRTASGRSDASRRSSPPGVGASVPESADNLLIVSRSAVLAEPMRGPAWESLLATAEDDLGDVDLSDQNSKTAARTYAAAMVYVRTGQPQYRDKVVAQLRRLPRASTPARRGDSGGGVLSVARQLSGYIMAARMVGYTDKAFVAFVDEIRDREIGGHGRWESISQTSEDTSNNWGAWALATRLAASMYLRDSDDIEQVASIFARYTGESTEFSGWRPTQDFDSRWACTKPVVGINPASCGERSGAMVEDISRSGSYPKVNERGLSYSWEAMGGSVITAKLLYLGGYPEVFEWGDKALLRAAEFLYSRADGPPRHAESRHLPWAINRAYGADLAPLPEPGYGWAFGFTDWLY